MSCPLLPKARLKGAFSHTCRRGGRFAETARSLKYFGNGRINVFNDDGTLVDQLEDAYRNPLAIDGLWTLTLGGGRKSSSDALYFSAGPNKEVNGLFGTIAPISASKARASAQHGQ
jgi:hypothetical protein